MTRKLGQYQLDVKSKSIHLLSGQRLAIITLPTARACPEKAPWLLFYRDNCDFDNFLLSLDCMVLWSKYLASDL